ncbi:substrate-binding domain-containing protein, partial [Nocardioides hankookensis]
DVAVVGFDDAPIGLSTTPPLTTVHQSPEQMGREMVAMLLEATGAPGVPQPGLMLPTHLVVRGSA